MKLSELKALVAAVEADARAEGNKDPNVSFWPNSEAEKMVKGLMPRRSIFVDMDIDTDDVVADHRITADGATRGDYSIPLRLYERD